MTIRSLATSASVVALCLVGAIGANLSSVVAREPIASFTVAAAQSTAPNFIGISNWFNSAPLSMAGLRGKVVLVDFWTYGCVNCVNTLPHVTELYAKYKDRGLVARDLARNAGAGCADQAQCNDGSRRCERS